MTAAKGPAKAPGKTKPASAAAARRRAREKEILLATRQLFDETGVRDAQIEDIARAVGINRAIIYRHFSGKEELFALTLVTYLEELQERLKATVAAHEGETEQLVALVEAFVDFGVEFPAFVDCAQTVMRRPGPELLEEVSMNAMFSLGQKLSGCLVVLVNVLKAGMASGEFKEVDADLLANHMYASGLGAMQLARIGMLVKEAAPGIPTISPLSSDQVKAYVVLTAKALAVG